ncbi:hypothetical protein [Microseira sp. BLCC-F43]|jgi:hypothetical protein|uniref:hypothetical protein n=1 Tax=Microseira sp. BLCC-F43 TaxID=3153602 RepID=UPI0035B966F6
MTIVELLELLESEEVSTPNEIVAVESDIVLEHLEHPEQFSQGKDFSLEHDLEQHPTVLERLEEQMVISKDESSTVLAAQELAAKVRKMLQQERPYAEIKEVSTKYSKKEQIDAIDLLPEQDKKKLASLKSEFYNTAVGSAS